MGGQYVRDRRRWVTCRCVDLRRTFCTQLAGQDALQKFMLELCGRLTKMKLCMEMVWKISVSATIGNWGAGRN